MAGHLTKANKNVTKPPYCVIPDYILCLLHPTIPETETNICEEKLRSNYFYFP